MKDLLFNLLAIYNPSGLEKNISNYIKKYLDKHNIKYQEDTEGNIYNFNNLNAPFLSAHLDSVKILTDKYYITENNGLINTEDKAILGGDDATGIAIILEILRTRKDLNFNWILTAKEESGGEGAKFFSNKNKKLLEDSLYGIVLDRRGNSDIICEKNEYGVKKFEDELAKIGKNFKYIPNYGVWSDADIWSEYCSVANLSSGYYNPHTSKEYIIIEDVIKAKEFTISILENIKEKFDKPVKDYWFDLGYRDYYKRDLKKYSSTKTCDCCGIDEEFLVNDQLVQLETLNGLTLCEYCAKEVFLELKEKLNKSYEPEEIFELNYMNDY